MADSEGTPLQVGGSNTINTTSAPTSLVATEKDHSKRNACLSKCFNHLYDALTILISIADIATDVMVLLSYYASGRMTFFWISLTVLLVAQIGYLIVFFMAFDVEDFVDNVKRVCCCDFKPCKPISRCWASFTQNTDSVWVQCTVAMVLFPCLAIVGALGFCCLLPKMTTLASRNGSATRLASASAATSRSRSTCRTWQSSPSTSSTSTAASWQVLYTCVQTFLHGVSH